MLRLATGLLKCRGVSQSKESLSAAHRYSFARRASHTTTRRDAPHLLALRASSSGSARHFSAEPLREEPLPQKAVRRKHRANVCTELGASLGAKAARSAPAKAEPGNFVENTLAAASSAGDSVQLEPTADDAALAAKSDLQQRAAIAIAAYEECYSKFTRWNSTKNLQSAAWQWDPDKEYDPLLLQHALANAPSTAMIQKARAKCVAAASDLEGVLAAASGEPDQAQLAKAQARVTGRRNFLVRLRRHAIAAANAETVLLKSQSSSSAKVMIEQCVHYEILTEKQQRLLNKWNSQRQSATELAEAMSKKAASGLQQLHSCAVTGAAAHPRGSSTGSDSQVVPPSPLLVSALALGLDSGTFKQFCSLLKRSQRADRVDTVRLRTKMESIITRNCIAGIGQEELTPLVMDYLCNGTNPDPASMPAAPPSCPYPRTYDLNTRHRSVEAQAAQLLQLRERALAYGAGDLRSHPHVQQVIRSSAEHAASARVLAERLCTWLPPATHMRLQQLFDSRLEEPEHTWCAFVTALRARLGPHSWLFVPDFCLLLGLFRSQLYRQAWNGFSKQKRHPGQWAEEHARAALQDWRELEEHLRLTRTKLILDSIQLQSPYSFEALDTEAAMRAQERLRVSEARAAATAAREEIVQDVIGGEEVRWPSDQLAAAASAAAGAAAHDDEQLVKPPALHSYSREPQWRRWMQSGVLRLQANDLLHSSSSSSGSSFLNGSSSSGSLLNGSSSNSMQGWESHGDHVRKEFRADDVDSALSQLPADEEEEMEADSSSAAQHQANTEEEDTAWESTPSSLTIFRDPFDEAGKERLSAADRRIFVKNLPPRCTDEELWNAMSLCGEVQDVMVYHPPVLAGDSPPLDPEVQLKVDRGELLEAEAALVDPSTLKRGKERLKMHKRRLLMTEEVRAGESPHSRSMVHAFVQFKHASGYQAATHPAMRIFGLNLKHHNCRVQPAHNRTSLFMDTESVLSTTLDDSMSDKARYARMLSGPAVLESALSQLLQSRFTLQQPYSSNDSSASAADAAAAEDADSMPSMCRLDFPTHEAALAAEQLLFEQGVDAYWVLRRTPARPPSGQSTPSRYKAHAIAARLRLPKIDSVTLGAGLLDAVDADADTAREDEIVI